MNYEDATPELQLLMRRHGGSIWEKDSRGEIKLGMLVKGTYHFQTVTPNMLAVAQRQIDTGTSYRGELDFPDVRRQPRRFSGKRRSGSGR
jgi:hypothetical protein